MCHRVLQAAHYLFFTRKAKGKFRGFAQKVSIALFSVQPLRSLCLCG